MEEMPLVAPLFIEDRNMSSELVLVNNSSENAGSTISLRNLHGIETGHLHLVLKPHEDRHIPVRTLEANVASLSRYGSLVVMPDSDLKGPSIAGQLLITDRSSSTPAYLDEELAMPDMQGSSVLRSVTDDTERQPLLAVTNLSAQAQKAVVRCLGSNAKQRQTTLDLAPFATSLIAACSGSFVSDIDHFLSQAADRTSSGVTGIEVIGDGVAGEIAAYAIAPHRRNSDVVFSSVPFTDPALIHSPDSVFAGVPIGPQPTLPNGVYIPRISLSNFASTPARVTVALHVTARSRMESSDGGSSVVAPQTLASLTIPARQTREIVLKGTESQSGLLNSVYVSSDKQPGEVQGKLVSRSDGSLYEIELLGKDVRDLENGGIHPWTSEDDAESHLILYNHSNSQKKFDVAVWNGTMLWDKTYYVDASETLEISFNQLMRDKVKDDRKQVLDPALTHGVVNWSTPDGGDATGRLMVTSRGALMARNYSCGSYIVPCGGVFQTFSNFIGINQILGLFDLSVQYCSAWGPGQCGGNQVGSGSASFSSTTSAPTKIAFYNASQNSQSPTMRGMAAGTSNFLEEADGNGCRVSDGGSANATSVSIAGPFTVSTGGTIVLTATGNPSGGTYSWVASNPNVILANSTTANVAVKCITVGSTVLTVTYSEGEMNTQATQVVTVQQAPPTLTVHTAGSKSTGDNLLFSSDLDTCSESLGLKKCPNVIGWNVEFSSTVPDDASKWTIKQSIVSERAKGYEKSSSGSLTAFDSGVMSVPNDGPESIFLQQKAGTKSIFFLDSPSLETIDSHNGNTNDSFTEVQNFSEALCSTTTGACYYYTYYLKIVVKPGGIIDTVNSVSGTGAISTSF